MGSQCPLLASPRRSVQIRLLFGNRSPVEVRFLGVPWFGSSRRAWGGCVHAMARWRKHSLLRRRAQRRRMTRTTSQSLVWRGTSQPRAQLQQVACSWTPKPLRDDMTTPDGGPFISSYRARKESLIAQYYERLIEPIMGSRARPVASALCRLDSKSNECAQTSRPRTHACNRA